MMDARIARSIVFALSSLACAPIVRAQSTPPAVSAPIDRTAFARRIARVHSGMSHADVRAILGPPDDTLDRLDPQLTPPHIVTEVWSYGAAHHGDVASLGSVAFTARGTVFITRGGEGRPLAPASVSEARLRELFALLAALPGLRGDDYDPRPVIRAVNALQPLGAANALDVIAEYLRIAPTWTEAGTEGVFFVLRALFVPNGGAPHPVMHVGAPTTTPPATGAPAFPLVIVDDIPLLVNAGYMLGGFPEQPESHLAFYRTSAAIRSAPLRPNDHPLATFDRLEHSSLGAALFGTRNDGASMMLMEQLSKLVAGTYEPPFVQGVSHLPWPPADAHATWRAMVTAYDALGAHWDPVAGEYARAGAAAVTFRPARRVLWTHVHRGANAEVFFERVAPSRVRTWVHFERATPGAAAGGEIHLLAMPARTLAARQILASFGSYGVSDIALPRNAPVIVHFERDGATLEEAVTVP